jgi:hypothetical protein
MMLPVVTELSEMYRAADTAAQVTMLAKLAVEKCLTSKLDDTRMALQVGVGERCRRCEGLDVEGVGCVLLCEKGLCASLAWDQQDFCLCFQRLVMKTTLSTVSVWWIVAVIACETVHGEERGRWACMGCRLRNGPHLYRRARAM